jgi:tRNA G18 (ribose-2'-O)-methylase SpoU
MIVGVRDPADPLVADYRRLTDAAWRRRFDTGHGMFVAESMTVIERALDAGCRPESVFVSDGWLSAAIETTRRHGVPESVPLYVASVDVLSQVAGFHVHRGALAAFQRPATSPVAAVVAGTSRVLVLEGTVDHTNVGASFRSAAALGFDAVLLDPRAADPLYRRSVRVSMGAVFDVPWARAARWPNDLATLVDDGFDVVALTPDVTAQSLVTYAADPPPRVAVVVGSEGPGLSRHARSVATSAVRIPMSRGVDSVNVAAAVAIACFALASDRTLRTE